MDFAKRLKTVRKILGIKQDELAQLSNISRSYLANVEAKKLNLFLMRLLFFYRSVLGLILTIFLKVTVFKFSLIPKKLFSFCEQKISIILLKFTIFFHKYKTYTQSLMIFSYQKTLVFMF